MNAFALCQWLITGRKDLENLKEAVRWREVWFNDQAKSEKTEVQLTLADYLNAEEYETVLARYAAAGLTPPKALRNIKGEGTMCYVLVRHRLGLEYSTEEVGTAVETFLKRSMAREWLDRGQFDTVAVWMMLTQWKPGDDPIATLLKCYKYLPNLTCPRKHRRGVPHGLLVAGSGASAEATEGAEPAALLQRLCRKQTLQRVPQRG